MGEDEKNKAVKPKNFREVHYSFEGQDVTIAGMAKPDYKGAVTVESMLFLNEQSYQVLVGLHPEDRYMSSAKEHGISYNPMKVKDFTAPDIHVFETTYQVLSAASKKNQNVAIHCGEGYGRTGTVLAALKLKEFILKLDESELIQQPLNEHFQMGRHADNQSLKCTPLIKKAITEVRTGGEKDDSVENSLQIKSLLHYQSYMINVRRQEEIEKLSNPPLKRFLLNAQQQWYQQYDFHMNHQRLLLTEGSEPNDLDSFEKLTTRYEIILSMSDELKNFPPPENELARKFYENLLTEYQQLADDVLTDIDKISQRLSSKLISTQQIAQLFATPSAIENILKIQDNLDALSSHQVSLFDGLNTLILKMQDDENNPDLGDENIYGSDIEESVNDFLTVYETILEVDKHSLPSEIIEQVDKLKAAIKMDSVFNDRNNLIHVRRLELSKTIEDHKIVLQDTKSNASNYVRSIRFLDNLLGEKNEDQSSFGSAIEHRIKTNPFLSNMFDKSSLAQKPFDLNSVRNCIVLLKEIPLIEGIVVLSDMADALIKISDERELYLLMLELDEPQQKLMLDLMGDTILTTIKSIDGLNKLMALFNEQDIKNSLIDKFENQLILMITNGYEIPSILNSLSEDKQDRLMENLSGKLQSLLDDNCFCQIVSSLKNPHSQNTLIENSKDNLSDFVNDNIKLNILLAAINETHKPTIISTVLQSSETFFTDPYDLAATLELIDNSLKHMLIQQISGSLPNLINATDELLLIIETMTPELITTTASLLEDSFQNIINSVSDFEELLAGLDEDQQRSLLNAIPSFLDKFITDNGGMNPLKETLQPQITETIEKMLTDKNDIKTSHQHMSQLLGPSVKIAQEAHDEKDNVSLATPEAIETLLETSDPNQENTTPPNASGPKLN